MQLLIVLQLLQTIGELMTGCALVAIAVHEIFGSNGWRDRGKRGD